MIIRYLRRPNLLARYSDPIISPPDDLQQQATGVQDPNAAAASQCDEGEASPVKEQES